MLAIILTIVFFCMAILIHEFGHFLVAKVCHIKVNEFSIGMGPSLFHRQKKETKYSIRALPIGGYVAMEGEDEHSDDLRSFQKRPIYQRMLVILAGAFMNFVLGLLLVGILLVCQGKTASTEIDRITNPNASSQMQVGDTIIKVNGHSLLCAGDLRFELQRIPANQAINITVKRNGETIELNDVGILQTDEQGNQTRVLGIQMKVQPLTLGNFFPSVFGNSFFYAKLVVCSLGDLITGKIAITQLSGPVGVVQAVGQAETAGWLSVLSLFAFLTINIGLFNLIPFPALDGGQFLFLLIEAIFRKPIKKEIQSAINMVGLGLLFLLMIVITIKDIIYLF